MAVEGPRKRTASPLGRQGDLGVTAWKWFQNLLFTACEQAVAHENGLEVGLETTSKRPCQKTLAHPAVPHLCRRAFLGRAI